MNTRQKIGFIGCGNMGGALVRAAARAVPDCQFYLCDHHADRVAALAAETHGTVCDGKTAAEESDFLFLGVKPQGMEKLFEELRPVLQKRTAPCVLVSMAAGLSVSHVEALSGGKCPVIRIMPNTPVSVGAGMILYAVNSLITEEMEHAVLEILSAAGVCDRLDEAKMDAAGALSGCGPAYVYLFAEALADGAVACGLPRGKANTYAAQTLLGAAKLLLDSGEHPGALKDAVCSPGGTTIAGVHALESGAFRACAMDAVIAAYERTLELKK